MKCPICSEELVESETGNGGSDSLYVMEDMGMSTECFDPDIKMYRCPNKHTIYISEE